MSMLASDTAASGVAGTCPRLQHKQREGKVRRHNNRGTSAAEVPAFDTAVTSAAAWANAEERVNDSLRSLPEKSGGQKFVCRGSGPCKEKSCHLLVQALLQCPMGRVFHRGHIQVCSGSWLAAAPTSAKRMPAPSSIGPPQPQGDCRCQGGKRKTNHFS